MRRQRKKLPSPSQLHFPDIRGGERINHLWVEFRDKFWSERLAEGLVPLPSDPAYRVEHYSGLPAQHAYRRTALKMAVDAGSRVKDVMCDLAIRKAQVPLEAFKDVMPDTVFDHQVERLQSDLLHWPVEVDQMEATTMGHLWQSCFGLSVPAQTETARATCASCPQQEACTRVRQHVMNTLVRTEGSSTPVDDKDRIDATLRKRKQRERERKAAEQVVVVS